MALLVSVYEAKTQLSRLMEEAHAGREIILAKGGKPYARLVPLASSAGQTRVPGRLPGQVDEAFFDPLPAQELAAWEGR